MDLQVGAETFSLALLYRVSGLVQWGFGEPKRTPVSQSRSSLEAVY